MTFVITVAQQKGGAGKTTLAAHIAIALSQKGKRVAVIDIDPQKTLKTWYSIRENKMGEEYTGLTFSDIAGWRVSGEISRLGYDHDYIVIDCPPHTETETRSAISDSNLVVIPVQPSPADIWATRATIDLAKKEMKSFITVFNRMPNNSKLAKELANNLENLVDINMGNRVLFSSCFLSGKTVLELDPKGIASLEIKSLIKKIEKILITQKELA